MEKKRSFEATWPELEVQLRSALTRRRVPFDAREDVLQETALRLLRSWDRILPESLWAFALTVALNIVRDEARKKDRRDRVVIDDIHVERDPEHEALVRIELERVRVALTSMTERQREILLAEVGEAPLASAVAGTAALKMARMRARRRLRSLIEGVSGYASLSMLRLRRWFNDLDAGMANGAASFAVQVAAVVALSSMPLPGTIDGPLDARQRPSGHVTRTAEAATAGTVQTLSQPSAPDALSDELRYAMTSTMRGTAVALRTEKKQELNQHFGVVHKEGDSIHLGGEEQVGPYGAHKWVSQVVGDSELGAGGRVRYDPDNCVNEFLRRPHSPCSRPGSLRARVRAVVEDKKHDIDVASDPLG